MFRYTYLRAAFGGVAGILFSSCFQPADVAVPPRKEPASAQGPGDFESALPVPLSPEAFGGEVVAVTVIDPYQLRYRLVSRERFYLLKNTAPDAHFFRHVKVNSATELEDLLDQFSLPEMQALNFSITAFPRDLDRLPASRRKAAFIRVLLPLVNFHNQIVAARRERLERLRQNRALELEERLFLEEMCQQYRLERLADSPTTLDDTLRVLLSRTDQIPPSIILAQAAIESGWGTSRISRQGNNLFGEGVWARGGGEVGPLGDERPQYNLAVFPTIDASIRSYMRNLNTHPAYEEFRRLRQRMRRQEVPLDPVELAHALERYSTRGQEYVEEVLQFIAVNELTRYDVAMDDRVDEPSI